MIFCLGFVIQSNARISGKGGRYTYVAHDMTWTTWIDNIGYLHLRFCVYRFRDSERRRGRYRRFQHVHGTLVLLRKYGRTHAVFIVYIPWTGCELSVWKPRTYFVPEAEKPIVMVLTNAIPPMLDASLTSAMSYLNNNSLDTGLFQVDQSNCRYGQNLVGYSTTNS